MGNFKKFLIWNGRYSKSFDRNGSLKRVWMNLICQKHVSSGCCQFPKSSYTWSIRSAPLFNPFRTGNPIMGTMVNSEGPDEMLHHVALYQGLHCLLRTFCTVCWRTKLIFRVRNKFYGENYYLWPLNNIQWNILTIECSFVEKSIGLQWVKHCLIHNIQTCLKLKKDQKLAFKTDYRFMQFKSTGSAVVECLIREWGAWGSSLTSVAVLCPWARHIYPSLVLVQPRKTCPCLTERLLMGSKESNQTNKKFKSIAECSKRYVIQTFVLSIFEWPF